MLLHGASQKYFNPRSPCGERQLIRFLVEKLVLISIHAPRVGSDSLHNVVTLIDIEISIHAPRVGSDSAPSPPGGGTKYFNPRSPCGERHDYVRSGTDARLISIHAPRVGSDSAPSPPGGGTKYFNPRSPCGERHSAVIFVDICRYFNPRSPCGERLLVQLIRREERYFNPRSPCGERPLGLKSVVITLLFQSTLPVWGATRS